MVEVERLASPRAEDAAPAAAWLREIARTRDLTARFDGMDAEPLNRFVAGLRGEMLDFRAIVEAAAETAALNGEQLTSIVRSTAEQHADLQRNAQAVAEIDAGAASVARTTHELRELSGALTGAAGAYDGGIGAVLAGLNALAESVEETGAFASAMESGSSRIRGFVDELRRIARQARLLSINAAIEAAHLGDAGKGFVIVAGEVKRLAESTAGSSADVASIDKQLFDASRHVDAAIGTSAGIVRALAGELGGARERSAQTRAEVAELDAAIGEVASIAEQQSAGVSAIAAGVEKVARHAQDVDDAAQRAAKLAIGDALDRLHDAVARYRLGGTARSAADAFGVDDLPEPLRDAAAELRARVDEDQRELLALVTAIAVSIARNSYEWKAIASSLGALRAELQATIDRRAHV